LDAIEDKRILLLTGKGGVGRSIVTAALAHIAQRRGRRVLVAELGDDPDDYSPLARYFGRDRLPVDPEELAPGIRGVVLLARTGQDLFLRQVLRSSTLSRAALGSDPIRRLLSAGPSFREMGIFFQLLALLRLPHRDGGHEHEVVIVDMPATGHALSLTGLPDLLLRLVPGGPIADALREGKGYLNDPAQSAAWVVTLPETLPVSECLELLAGLRRTEMPIGGVFLNRFPVDAYTPEERAALAPILAQHDVLGAETFNRPGLAHRETTRLRASTDAPIYVLPEVPHAHVVAALTEAAERAWLLPRPASSASPAPAATPANGTP
jgi:anion-transporting  ArsA/GET3 family ATPase